MLSEEERLEDVHCLERARQMWADAEKAMIQGMTNQLKQDVSSESKKSSELEKATQRLEEQQRKELLELQQAKKEQRHAEELRRRYMQ